MARGEVDVVLVGADRVAANGDTANKVGTYPLAVLAARHGIPFYVVRADDARSTSRRPTAPAIPIEERAADEVTRVPRRPHRAARHRGPQPGLRRDAGRADHRDRHRGGRRPRAVRGRASRAATAAARARWAADAGLPRGPAARRSRRRADARRRPADGHRRASAGATRSSPAPTTDRALLRSFLERDRLYAAYAICDLEEREFARTRWGVRVRRRRARSRSSSSTTARRRSRCS